MNIKSLLLGAAAAVSAAPLAHAADAVVIADPEPVEYVRVCDVYGAGYFYIPGTETCLRIGGYVQYDVAGGDLFATARVDHLDGGVNDSYFQRTRFVLETFTGTETELGTLKTYTQNRFNWTPTGGTSTSLRQAWIELGGFRVGKVESSFQSFLGYAGGVINDDLIPFGPAETNQISYTFTSGGFTGMIGAESGGTDYSDQSQQFQSNTHDFGIDSYVPHVVAGAKYKGDWGSVGLIGGYDSVHEKFTVKARLDAKFNDRFSAFVMGGWGEDDLEFDVAAGRFGRFNYYKSWLGEWAVWGGGTAVLTDKAKLNVQVSYDAAEELAAVANIDYTVVPGFRVIPEIAYKDGGKQFDGDAFGGWVRFRRSF
jgi:opacity protein-like surface antigen